MRAALFDLMGSVIASTPVDTARARSGWHVGLNAVILTVPPPFPKGTKGNKGQGPTGEQLGELKAATDAFVWGDTFYLSNNLPYIGRLEDGHSLQAPAGTMLEANLRRVAANLKTARAAYLEQTGLSPA